MLTCQLRVTIVVVTIQAIPLQCVIEHLRSEGRTSTIALWGRSMGAATALLHGERDPSIAALVLDSAFANLVLLAEEMVETGRQQVGCGSCMQ